MNNTQEELYVFLRLSAGDLEQCINSLKTYKRYKKKDIVSALLRDAIISYTRPFSGNQGIYKEYGLRIQSELVPEKRMKTHSKIIDYRNQIIAHNDLKWKKPSLTKIKSEDFSIYPIAYRKLFFEELTNISEPLLELCKDVLSNLKIEIVNYEENIF